MKRLVLLFFFTFFTLSLEAYSKKVILASFSTEQRAQGMIKKLPSISPTVISLSKKYNFDLKVRKSGKYHVLVAEVFYDKVVLNTFLKQIRKRFKGAYVSKYKVIKIEKAPKPKKIEVKKKVKVEKIVEKVPEVKKEIKPEIKKVIQKQTVKIQEEIINKNADISFSPIEKQLQRTQEKLSVALDIFHKYFGWTYLILLIVFSIFTYYYIKFKKIYDEY